MNTPCLRPVADTGVLVEFGDRIDEAVHARVLALDAALLAEPFTGFTESVPAFTSILIGYDPLRIELREVLAHIERLLAVMQNVPVAGTQREVLVCYEPPFAPDLHEAAKRVGMSEEALIAAHLAGEYRVYMYGFAPGYAYLGGVPQTIRIPRKTEPVRGLPAGSVMIAGAMALVTTMIAPTGWWVIGRSPTQILRPEAGHPFLFEVGDRVRFRRISADLMS